MSYIPLNIICVSVCGDKKIGSIIGSWRVLLGSDEDESEGSFDVFISGLGCGRLTLNNKSLSTNRNSLIVGCP